MSNRTFKFWLVLSGILFLSPGVWSKAEFVRVIFNQDGSNHATIGWHQSSGGRARLRLWKGSAAGEGEEHRVNRSAGFRKLKNKFVRLDELEAGTRYFFRVEDNQDTSRLYYFETLPSDPTSPISIIAGGDSRSQREQRKNAAKMVAKLKPDLVIFAGDFTHHGTAAEYQAWFEDWDLTIPEDGRVTPIIVTRGNHERSNKHLTHMWDVPESRVYYNVRLGNGLLNVIVLNTEIKMDGKQSFALTRMLREGADCTWQLPVYHKPVRPHVSFKGEGVEQYEHWVPQFEESGVKLVVECDAHTCSRTWPIRSSSEKGSHEGFIRDDEKGIVYIGEGCWGAPIRASNDKKPWTRDAEPVYSFKWMEVSPQMIRVRTVKYMNADQVEESSEVGSYELPQGIDLWDPENGAEIEIRR